MFWTIYIIGSVITFIVMFWLFTNDEMHYNFICRLFLSLLASLLSFLPSLFILLVYLKIKKYD